MNHTCLSFLILSLGAGASLAGELAPEVREALDKVRDTRAGMYDTFESSVLGRTATPAETAATQRNWRACYSQPATTLSTTDREALVAKYGRVSLFGRPRTGRAFPLGIVGAEVIDVQGQPELTVTDVSPDAPAAGLLRIDDVIFGVNGRVFPQWEDPRVPMGYAIAAAQTKAHGGKLTLHVGRNGKVVDVTITLPVSEAYDEANPYDCARSRKVAAGAVEYILKNGDSTFWTDLFLMACGDERAIAVVRDRLRETPTGETVGSNWHGGYKLVSLCEYYLLTGDQEVLPAIRGHVRGLEKNQMPAGGWSHGAPGGYGLMNQVGQICFMGLVLAEECGVKVDPKVLARGVKLSGRFIGTYGAYGDHAPGVVRYGERAPFDNGIVPAHAVLFHLLGGKAVANRSARRSCYLYRTRMAGHAEHIFSIAWSSVGAALAPEAEYRMYANNLLWYYELARQRNGALKCLGRTRYGHTTSALGMTFAMANKRLRIAGGAKGAKPLFPVASLPTAPPLPPVKPIKVAAREIPSSATWDLLEIPAITAKAMDGRMPAITIKSQADPANYSVCRITLPATIGGEVWLNKHRVAIFSKPVSRGGLQTLTLGARAVKAMRQGENEWTIRSAEFTKPTALTIAMGPGGAAGKAMTFHAPEYGNNNRNGWVGTPEQHRQCVEWAFEDKSPREIARYLAYPDWAGARAAFQALALGGDESVALARQLVTDTHPGIRVGAWDAISEMNTRTLLDAATQKEFAGLAAARIETEDAAVGQAMGLAASPMAGGEALARILVGIAAMEDPNARKLATAVARKRLADQPELMIRVLRVVIAAKLNKSDIHLLGSAMGGVSSVPKSPSARDAVREIAGVLDEVAPDMRGMFTDGLMHGGLTAIDHNFDAELEKTPQLVSGLIKCAVKVPDTDWPGWAFANQYFRRIIYRLGADSADEILRVCEELPRTIDDGSNDVAQRRLRIQELTAWAGVLKRTGGDPAKLRVEALKLTGSDKPNERLIALSLVWPSDAHLGPGVGRYRHARVMTDKARIQDPATRLAVAIEAARHVETNESTHWLLIWRTLASMKDQAKFEPAPILAAFFDRAAWRVRGTFMFDAIDIAADLAADQLAHPVLARGVCKTYATSSSGVWYAGTQKKLKALTQAIPAGNADAVAQAVSAMKDWHQGGPDDEKKAVLVRGTSLQEYIKELEAFAGSEAPAGAARR